MNAVKHILGEETCGTTKAAKMLQVSVGTIHHMIERGDLEAWFTVGGHRRIPLDSIRNCQMRRRINTLSSSPSDQVISIIVLANDIEVLMKLKRFFASNSDRQEKQVTFFSDSINMMLDLDSLNPNLIMLDKKSLSLLGGHNWFTQLRGKEKYKQTQVLVISEDLNVEEEASVIINKVDVITESLDEGWMRGYIQALTTSWKLSFQF